MAISVFKFQPYWVVIVLLSMFCQLLQAETSASVEEDSQSTAQQLETLKQSVLKINRDLFILEEDLLFPASTQLVVYFSMDIGAFFTLDNIKIKLDDKDITHYLYTQNDLNALNRGAIQKLYLGNLTSGQHQLVAVMIGKGPHKRDFRKAVSFDFEKTNQASALEVQLRDDPSKQQPALSVVEWKTL